MFSFTKWRSNWNSLVSVFQPNFCWQPQCSESIMFKVVVIKEITGKSEYDIFVPSRSLANGIYYVQMTYDHQTEIKSFSKQINMKSTFLFALVCMVYTYVHAQENPVQANIDETAEFQLNWETPDAIAFTSCEMQEGNSRNTRYNGCATAVVNGQKKFYYPNVYYYLNSINWTFLCTSLMTLVLQ